MGKTATAQIFDNELGRYSDYMIYSYGGIFPKDDPQIIIYGSIKHPKTGTQYKADMVRSGTGDKGNWQLVAVKDEKGKKQITIWLIEEIQIAEGDMFLLERIEDVEYKAKKYNDQWKDQVNIRGVISKMENTTEMEEPVINDVELPF